MLCSKENLSPILGLCSHQALPKNENNETTCQKEKWKGKRKGIRVAKGYRWMLEALCPKNNITFLQVSPWKGKHNLISQYAI